jgi:ATP-dependent RNA helicase DeaD
MPFAERGLKESLTRALTQLGYENPTPIQSQAREAFKTGKSIVGQSKTGTGKTAAFLLPLLQEIDPSIKKVTAIILVPTRELAVQTQEACFDLGRYSRVRALAAY